MANEPNKRATTKRIPKDELTELKEMLKTQQALIRDLQTKI